MKSKSYRLDEYCITEYDDVALSWERHVPLAEQRSGRCSVLGDVLILGECTNQETGYLSGEFFDRLRELPEWSRTRYYCMVSDLLDTHTGQSLTDDALAKGISSLNAAGKSSAAPAAGNYRLGRYRIAVNADGNVYWQTHEDLQGVVGGRCTLESAFLFIGPREFDRKDQGRQDFSDELAHLAQLDTIVAWGRSEVLRMCRKAETTVTQNMRREDNVVPFRVERVSRPAAEIVPIPSGSHYGEVIRSFLQSAAGRLKIIREQYDASQALRRGQKRREQEDASSSPAVRLPVAEIAKATSGQDYAERIRNVLSSAVSSLQGVRQRMSLTKGWLKCVVPAVITVLLLGAALSYYMIEHLSESSHHSRERHHKHHD